ncbi:MAG: AMIN domain-containing protein [Candidatus Aminicenantes bacterium]
MVRGQAGFVRVLFLLVVLSSMTQPGSFGFRLHETQTSESFYLKLFNDGESSYSAGNYREAIKELEVAAFGLFHRKSLIGKAYILISLSYFHLENPENAAVFFEKATRWLDEEELAAVKQQLSQADRQIFEKLVPKPDVPGELDKETGTKEKETPVHQEKKPEKEEKEKPAVPPKKEPEKKKMPKTVQDRIKQLIEERTKQKTEESEKKDEIPAKKETSEGEIQNIQKTEDQIEGLEELFEKETIVSDQILKAVWIKKETNFLNVEILFQPYQSHRIFEIFDPLPKRIVIDIFNLIRIQASRSIEVNDFGIKSIRTGMYQTDVARVVFDAEGDIPSYRVEKIDGGLRVVIYK